MDTLIKVLLSLFLPPVGVFLQVGFQRDFWIDLLLTLLGHIPGVIYALIVLLVWNGNTKITNL